MTKEQQAVVARYREQQDAKSKQKVRNLCIVLSNGEHWNCWHSLVIDYKSLKSEKAYHFSLNHQTRRFRTFNYSMVLTYFVDQLSAPGALFSALTSSSLTDFNASATANALKWTDLEQNVVYQIVSTRTVNTQHGQSVILPLQKADRSSCSVWACGILTKELLQNPTMVVNSRVFVLSTGSKTSKMGRVYNSYQLLQC